MGKSSLSFIIPLAIFIFIFSTHLSNAQFLEYHTVANLSTTWINNPTINVYSSGVSLGFKITPVLSPSSPSHFISGFYCFPNETSCFFGIVIFTTRLIGVENYSLIAPQLVLSANRDRPVKVNATLKLTGDGDLMLEDMDGTLVWSTKTGQNKSVTGLRFTEFGNLVLFDRNNRTVWQSFDHPTDSLLIGQKLMTGQKLIASKASSDYSQGLVSLSLQFGDFFGYIDAYIDANPPLMYYRSNLDGAANFTNWKEVYVAFQNGSFNGQAIPVGSTAQFMRLEPDGHLKVYERPEAGDDWKTVADLLTSGISECGYPMVCGKYGICSSNGQCACLGGSSNETGNFRQISYKQPNLGCSLVTPITCNFPQYHSLLELRNTSYFNLNVQDNNNELNEKTGLDDCKNTCLRNCSCQAALFAYKLFNFSSQRGCLLLSEVFSLINIEGGRGIYINASVFLKVQNSPTKQPLSPIGYPPKKSRRGTIVLGSSLGAFFGVCLLVGSCILFFKRKREGEELDDEFSVDKVSGMPTRLSFNELKTATNDFSNKLGEGGFGSVFQGTLSDGTEVAVKCLDVLSQIKKSFLAEVQTIGNIHHVNLVRLTGFCSEKSRKLLVYEYMPNGSLDKWIFRQQPTLGWKSRKKIILDVAKGLAYLHEECRQKIYHLDIKPQNILLDDHFNAKISDFGLAKLIDKNRSQVVTTMRGTVGYLAPEWLSSIITEKVDVYSFGVVVLEILCGRKNLDWSQPEEDKHLLSLFKRKVEEGLLSDLVDKQNDEMQLHGAEVVEMMRVALWCLQCDFTRRPSMSVVVKVLEGSMEVENNLDYSFTSPVVPRTIAAAASHLEGGVCSSAPMLPSTLSGPR